MGRYDLQHATVVNWLGLKTPLQSTFLCCPDSLHTPHPQEDPLLANPPKKRSGTDADLRKLKLDKAKNVLRGFGVPEEDVSGGKRGLGNGVNSFEL